MATDNIDEVFSVETAMETPPVEEAPVEEVQQEPEPESEPAPEVVEAPAPEPEARHVPITALLDERDKRKELERRLAEFEAKQQVQPQQTEIPDPYDDPAGFAAHQQKQVEQQIVGVRFEMSDRFARQAHGDETVQGAIDWAMERAQKNPAFAQEYMANPDPIEWIVQQHKRDAMLSDIGDSPDDWFEREAAKRGYAKPSANASAVVADAAPKQVVQPAKVPPRSLANQGGAVSDIRHVATGPTAAVDSLFS